MCPQNSGEHLLAQVPWFAFVGSLGEDEAGALQNERPESEFKASARASKVNIKWCQEPFA